MKYYVNFKRFVCTLRFLQLCKSDDIDSWSSFGVITKVELPLFDCYMCKMGSKLHCSLLPFTQRAPPITNDNWDLRRMPEWNGWLIHKITLTCGAAMTNHPLRALLMTVSIQYSPCLMWPITGQWEGTRAKHREEDVRVRCCPVTQQKDIISESIIKNKCSESSAFPLSWSPSFSSFLILSPTSSLMSHFALFFVITDALWPFIPLASPCINTFH